MVVGADGAMGSAVSFKTSAAGASYRDAMSTPRLAVFGIVVADMPASLAFYRRLGLDLAPTADAEPHVAFDLPGGMQLAWDTVDTIRSFDAGWEPPTGDPRSALAFDCGAPAEVDRLYGELIAAGASGHLPPWDAFWGMRYASLRDPDGNGVDLFALLPTSG